MTPKAALVNSYLAKMEDPDVDFRYMALNDLTNMILDDSTLFGADEALEAKTANKVIQLVQDKNSEVKNQAVKCLGQLVKIIKEPQMNSVVDSLVLFIGGKDDELRDIAGLALKTVTAELPNEGRLAERACSTLAPKLLAQVQLSQTPPETVIEMLSILSILLSRFPVYLADVHPSPVTTITPLLKHPRVAVRKRAAVVIAQSLPTASQAILDDLTMGTIEPSLRAGAPVEEQRTIVLLLGAMARHSPSQISAIILATVPRVLSLAEVEDEELREHCLQTLEALVLRCPSQMTPFIPGVIGIGTVLIKYDPNYNEDAEDEEMADADDEEDENLGEDYSDDEDTSYKIRRSAAKLLAAVVATRPDFLVTIYRSVAPVLIMRFSEREESVRLDVWATYSLLLQQTNLYGSTPQSKDTDSAAGSKRKRTDDGMDLEQTPIAILKTQVPGLSKSLLRHLQPRASDASLQAGFGVFRSLLLVAPGSLTNQMPLIASVATTILGKSTLSTSSLLHTTIIAFLDLLFSTHSPPSFSQVLPQITPALLKTLVEKDPRVAAAGFHAFATLLHSLKPVRSGVWVEQLYAEVIHKLERADTDAAVREQAEQCLAELWLCATDVVRSKDGTEWAALRKSGRVGGSVAVVSRVVGEVDFPSAWVDDFVTWTLSVIRRSVRNQKDEALVCLASLLKKYQSGLPAGLVATIIPQLLPYFSIEELSHFTNSLTIITLMLQMAPRDAYPVAEAEILPIIYRCAVSHLPTGLLLDSVVEFLGSLVAADPPIANQLIPGLTASLEKAAPNTASPLNASRCIGAIVRSEMGLAAATVNDFAKSIKPGSKAPDSRIVLSLHVVGEIGRFIDMTLQNDVFNNSLALFASESQDIRAAAAFAAGNIAIGNLHALLPIIIKQVSGSGDQRLLFLHALKEIVTHCSSHELEGIADALWPPLFENPENSGESARNVAAACLGRLTTTNASRYLPLLQAKLKDPSSAIRATVVASVRHTFADNAQSYDELLSPLIVDFLSLVKDSDLTVRKLSLTALNAAARNKPSLIRDHLVTLLPLLYGETAQKPELIRVVDMGPWKHRVDDGLETRKIAFETMYTILDTCLSNIDLHVFFTHVLRGLADESDEIKVLCHMMLFRLSQVAPTTISQRLDEVSPELEEAVKGAQVTKDTVKQDLERAGELQRSALRAIAALSKISSPTISPRMERLVESIEKGPLAREFREL